MPTYRRGRISFGMATDIAHEQDQRESGSLASQIDNHSRNRLADALLRRFGIRGIQATLKLLNELSHMQAIDQSVVHMDRYRHRASATRLSNFAERDARRR